MAKVLVIISTGFEEIEAISTIDILRRANIEVTIATINDILTIGANSITIQADNLLEDIDTSNFDMIVLPGGVDNTFNLATSTLVKNVLKEYKKKDKYIAAICAAPFVLHNAGVLNKEYTCYPSLERKIDSATHLPNEIVVKDEKVITSQGPATSMQFALELVKILKGKELYSEIKEGLLFK